MPPSGAEKETSPPSPDPAAAGLEDERFDGVFVVLMAGGFGTRFWPLSTPERPKQFLTELTGLSLYRQAAERARSLVPWDRILVMTNADHRHLVREQTPEVPDENILCEPLRRDTAAAIVLAAMAVRKRRPGSLMIVTPSDHLVSPDEAFVETMASAVARAREGGLGTIGVTPTHASTAFGYLEVDSPPRPPAPQPVVRFVEKPDAERAETYVASGRFLWNAGMFVWQAETLLEAAAEHLPGMHEALAPLAGHLDEACFDREAQAAFERIEPISIDFGIMEKAEDEWVVPATFKWSDVGGWLAAEDLVPADEGGNRVRGCVELDETKGTLVVGGCEDHPVLVAGLSDCIVVRGEHGTLVCHKSVAERIKPMVKRILGGE
jgi:mannose-1-phosphate guanylyltransferase